MSEKEFLFDLTLATSIRLKAGSEEEAVALLEKHLDCADANFGEINGAAIVAEVSLHDRPVLVEEEEPDVAPGM